MAGMMLADMGAEVICIERNTADDPLRARNVSQRGKQSVLLDLKQPEGRDALLALVEEVDVFIDPFRPGVCERLGIGPEICRQRNPRLIYARITGWGQTGPLAQAAGHDINYIAITGALHAIGTAAEPVVPLNLLGDMGGGGMLLVQGILAALLERHTSGLGQVVDVAMVDGTAQLLWMMHSLTATGHWDPERRVANLLDGGAHFYGIYECADGRHITLGAIEAPFHAGMIEHLGLDARQFEDPHDRSRWPEFKTLVAAAVKRRTRDEWNALLQGTDVCFAPVLNLSEAPFHPASIARDSYIEVDGVTQPAPAPRFNRTPSQVRHGTRPIGADTTTVLQSLKRRPP
jgi:alpha-methylacyl-CoA racemase